ncbi:MAG: transcription antitermination factor NusB [Phycisphaerae bacterium]|nr:transcription antitermination factor NusB [Phycisphaerae bacterium]
MPLDERSQARILALQALCLFDALGDCFAESLDAFLRDRLNYADLGWKRGPRPKLLELARVRATGTWHARETCDQYLRQYVPDWSIERMQPVDRNILRLGLYELLECPKTPPAIVINEAIELARRFGGAESPAFVNGVLDHVRRGLAAASEPVEPSPPK